MSKTFTRIRSKIAAISTNMTPPPDAPPIITPVLAAEIPTRKKTRESSYLAIRQTFEMVEKECCMYNCMRDLGIYITLSFAGAIIAKILSLHKRDKKLERCFIIISSELSF